LSSERVERRLTAILAADVAGYSRLTGMDEEGTHAQLQVDGNNVDVFLGLVETHMWEVNSYMSNARAEQLGLAEVAISKALELTPNSARTHFCRASVLIALRAPERALREIELAFSLDRDLSYLHVSCGRIKILLGRADEAEGHVTDAIRLSPRDPMLGVWYGILGSADLHLGRLDKAVDRLRRAVEIAPSNEIPYFYLAAALALEGRGTEAAEACRIGRRLAPVFRISKCRAEVQSDNSVFLVQRERVYEGLRKAGLPE
jgi:tetratricopeptide (TPR) repeat protein